MEIDHLHDADDFEVWYAYGLASSFCGPMFCPDHDGIPLTAAEEEILEDHGEICVPVIRIYRSLAEAKGVVANHTPTSWRDPRNYT
jgi:hypothetical protein